MSNPQRERYAGILMVPVETEASSAQEARALMLAMGPPGTRVTSVARQSNRRFRTDDRVTGKTIETEDFER